MDRPKLNFFQQIKYAVMKPLQYFRLTRITGGRVIGFVFLFALIISLFDIVPSLYNFVGPNGITNYLHEDLPAFEMSNGELYVDGQYEEDDGRTYMLIDTTVDKFSKDDVNDLYDQVLLISKTNAIMYQVGNYQDYQFSQYKTLSFDNEILDKLLPLFYLIVALVVIFTYLFTVGGYFFTALLYSLVGLIVSSITHANLKYAAIYKTAIYGKVTASILIAILSIIPIYIPGLVFKGISILITCAYVVYGTLSHNSDLAHEEAGITPPSQNY